MLLTCTSVGGCLVWQQTSSCSASSLVCANKGATVADCECAPLPAGTTSFYADAVSGSAAGAAPFPTGAQTPAQCRFKTLTATLSVASAAATTQGSAKAIATGATGLVVEVFANETFPLDVMPNVTLTTTDTTPTPANYVINFNDNTLNRSAVVVHDAASFSGFTVQNTATAANGASGISASCPSSGTIAAGAVTGVIVNGKSTVAAAAALTNGVTVATNCNLALDTVDAKACGTGLKLAGSSNTATVTATSSTFESNTTGVLGARGVLTLNSSTVKTNTGDGIRITPAGGQLVFSMTGGVIDSNLGWGVNVQVGSGATAASTASFTGTELKNNGINPGGPPIAGGLQDTAARPLTFNSVNVHDNASVGVTASGGAIVTVGGVSHFDTNGQAGTAAAGFTVSGAATTLTVNASNAGKTTFASNRGPGIHLGGGATGTFTGISVTGNNSGQAASTNAGAFEVEAATATVSGATVIQRNALNGIHAYSGTTTITGTLAVPIDVSNNGLASSTQPVPFSGAYVNAAAFTGTFLAFTSNGNHGVEIANTSLAAVGQQILVSNSTFTSNAGAGIRVDASSPLITSGKSLIVSSCTFDKNLHGFNLAASTGDIHAQLTGNTITNSTDSAIYLTGTANSKLQLDTNTITTNNVASGSKFGGFGAGGILLFGVNPATWQFFANVIHHNSLNQVLVVAPNGVAIPPTWDLSGSGGATCVAASANVFSCYDRSNPSFSVGVQAVGLVTVKANANSWQNVGAPAAGTDYSAAFGATFSPSPPTANCASASLTIPCP
jgi:hypothetical protein